MHGAVQTAVVTIISYKPLSGLNFARYVQCRSVWQLHALFSFRSLQALDNVSTIASVYAYVCVIMCMCAENLQLSTI